MKKLLFVFFACLSLNVFSQNEGIKYSDLIDTNVKKNTIKGYKSYLSKDGLTFNIGDTIKVGFPSSDQNFAFINLHENGQYLLLDKSKSGIKIIIWTIYVSGTKKTGFEAIAVCKTGVFMSKYEVQLENAIEKREIKTSLLSSDDALIQLKKAKDKLDLGLITQEDFDKLKVELKKYIK